MIFSCTDILVPGRTLTEKAKKLKNWGYEGIAVYADYESWTLEKEEELCFLEEKTGIKPVEFAFIGPKYGHLMDKNKKKSEETFYMYSDSIRIAKKIGALTELECDIRREEPPSFEFNEYPKLQPKEMEQFVGFMQSFCDLGKDTGTMVLLETVNRYEAKYVNLQRHAVEIVQKINRSNTGLLSDLFHMSLDEEDICQVLYDCAPYIKHIHLGDTNRRLPGKGAFDWKEIFITLKEIGYEGCLNLEVGIVGDAEELLKETASFLHKLAD